MIPIAACRKLIEMECAKIPSLDFFRRSVTCFPHDLPNQQQPQRRGTIQALYVKNSSHKIILRICRAFFARSVSEATR
jgi:hypothetical protein